jgi:hypothetical protein
MALNASIDLTVNKPDFKSMKAEIRELTVAAQQAVMQFGEFSPEAMKAEHALAQARDRMDDFNDRVKAVNPDKFSQLNTVVQGVARGFQAAQGAMALFGNQSEELEKTMIKLQGAMALAEGLEGLGKIQQQFTAIFTNVVSGAKKAFAAIKAGIGSTGIGLLVVALGSIVAYWDEIKEAVSGVSDEQKELLKNTQKTAEANEKSYDNISKSENILKAQGKTEEEILKLKINAAKVSIQNLKAQLTTQENVRQSQIDTATRNRDILQGMIRFIMFPLSILLKGIDEAGKALGQNFGLEEGFSKGIAQMLFNPEEVKQESDKSIQASKDALLKLENDVAGYELSIKDIRKKGAEDKKKLDEDAAQKELDDAAKLADEKKKITDDTLAAEASARDAARQKELALITDEGERIQKEYENKLAALQESQAQELKAVEGNAAAIAAINQKYNDLQLVATAEVDAAELKLAEERAAKQKEIDDKATDDAQKNADKIIKQEEAKQEAKDTLFKASVDLANSIAALAGEQTKAGKAIALSVIAADTAMAISGALNVTQKPSPDNIATGGLAGAAKYIGLAAMILTNAKKARDILKGGQPSAPTGMQSSGGGLPQMAAPQISSTLPQVSGFEQRVYVTEGDISRTQGRVASLKKVSVTQ